MLLSSNKVGYLWSGLSDDTIKERTFIKKETDSAYKPPVQITFPGEMIKDSRVITRRVGEEASVWPPLWRPRGPTGALFAAAGCGQSCFSTYNSLSLLIIRSKEKWPGECGGTQGPAGVAAGFKRLLSHHLFRGVIAKAQAHYLQKKSLLICKQQRNVTLRHLCSDTVTTSDYLLFPAWLKFPNWFLR